MHSTRNTFFDFLRLAGVLLVITSHYGYMFDTSPLLTFPREYLTGGLGRLGVSLFFMISGALAYVSLNRYTLREYYVKRACSVLIPYNIVYFAAGLTLLSLGVYFHYPENPLGQLFKGERSALSLLLPMAGIDHYLHGVWGMKTAYLTGEWFIGCIVLLYAVAPLIFRATVRAPFFALSAAVALSVLCYDSARVNPYWSAPVRISDFTAGMLFMQFQSWCGKQRNHLAVAGLITIASGYILAQITQQPLREMLFPLAPRSLIFAIAFLFILFACYPWVNRLFAVFKLQESVSVLASRAYIMMLIQHVVIIFISANVKMSALNVGQAILFYVLTLLITERLSAALKKPIARSEVYMTKRILNPSEKK